MSSVKTRIIRVLVGLIFMGVVGFVYESWWGLLGLIPFLVGVTGFCPACYFLNRCSIKH